MSDTQYMTVPGDTSFRPQKAPDNRFVQFTKRPHLNKIKSREAGRPIYDARVFITIQHPGDNNHVIERFAADADAAEFPRQWAAFQAGTAAIPEGTLLSILFPDGPEIVENLKYFKVFTIEQLAGLTDTQIQAIGMGGRKMSQDAQAYLKAAAGGSDFAQMRDRMGKLENAVKARDDKIKALDDELKRREAAENAKSVQGQQRAQPQRA